MIRIIFQVLLFSKYISGLSDCLSYNSLVECNADSQCQWFKWNPNLCQYKCEQFSSQDICEEAVNCSWYEDEDEQGCSTAVCTSITDQIECSQIVACSWLKNSCWDSTCISLWATKESECIQDYCKWNEYRQICYDKKCSDYSNSIECSVMSFCKWDKYKCVDNGNSKLTY